MSGAGARARRKQRDAVRAQELAKYYSIGCIICDEVYHSIYCTHDCHTDIQRQKELKC
jgi:hypothetical protein